MVIAWLKYIGIFLAAVVIVVTVGILITQRFSDGPIEFLQGGSFKTGELVEELARPYRITGDVRIDLAVDSLEPRMATIPGPPWPGPAIKMAFRSKALMTRFRWT